MKTYLNLDNGNVYKVDARNLIFILSRQDKEWIRSSRNAGDGLGFRGLTEIPEWL